MQLLGEALWVNAMSFFGVDIEDWWPQPLKDAVKLLMDREPENFSRGLSMLVAAHDDDANDDRERGIARSILQLLAKILPSYVLLEGGKYIINQEKVANAVAEGRQPLLVLDRLRKASTEISREKTDAPAGPRALVDGKPGSRSPPGEEGSSIPIESRGSNENDTDEGITIYENDDGSDSRPHRIPVDAEVVHSGEDSSDQDTHDENEDEVDDIKVLSVIGNDERGPADEGGLQARRIGASPGLPAGDTTGSAPMYVLQEDAGRGASNRDGGGSPGDARANDACQDAGSNDVTGNGSSVHEIDEDRREDAGEGAEGHEVDQAAGVGVGAGAVADDDHVPVEFTPAHDLIDNDDMTREMLEQGLNLIDPVSREEELDRNYATRTGYGDPYSTPLTRYQDPSSQQAPPGTYFVTPAETPGAPLKIDFTRTRGVLVKPGYSMEGERCAMGDGSIEATDATVVVCRKCKAVYHEFCARLNYQVNGSRCAVCDAAWK